MVKNGEIVKKCKWVWVGVSEWNEKVNKTELYTIVYV